MGCTFKACNCKGRAGRRTNCALTFCMFRIYDSNCLSGWGVHPRLVPARGGLGEEELGADWGRAHAAGVPPTLHSLQTHRSQEKEQQRWDCVPGFILSCQCVQHDCTPHSFQVIFEIVTMQEPSSPLAFYVLSLFVFLLWDFFFFSLCHSLLLFSLTLAVCHRWKSTLICM